MRHCTRREILATLLGLPAAALSGCHRQARDAEGLPPGQLLGSSASVGHKLIAGLRVRPPADRWTTVRVVIVGGGVAGYSAARRLLQAGWSDLVLLELENAPGGTSRSGQSEIVAYPWGSHYLPVPLKENRPLIELLDEMNLLEGYDEFDEPVVAQRFLCREPTERVFFKGRWYDGLVPKGDVSIAEQAQFQAFDQQIDQWVAWRDGSGRRAFALPLANCSDDPEVTRLDGKTMAEWMQQHGLSSPRLRWYVDYCCRDDYGMTIDRTSAWAGLFYFASRVRRPGDESQPLITWPEGNGRLVSHMHGLVERKATVRLGLAVTEIIPAANGERGVDVVAVEHDLKTGHGFHADYVIFAAPHFLRPYLIRHEGPSPPHVAEFEYGSWMVANLELSGRPGTQNVPPCWDNVLYESASLGYVVATHQLWRDRGPTVLTYYFPLCDETPGRAREKLLQLNRDDWAEVTLGDLQQAHPDLRGLVQRLDVMRWGHAMIQPRPGFIWGQARRAAAQPFRGVFFAHSDLSGMALFEEAFYHGCRAAEEVLAVADGRPASEG